jgi:HTH-type transcriptional regulator/antitoxin HigA
MQTRTIANRADYEAALKEVEGLMRAAPGTEQGERLDILVGLIEAYERKRFPLDPERPGITS